MKSILWPLASILLSTLATSTAYAQVVVESDDFSSPELNARWTYVDPLDDVTLGLQGFGTVDAQLRFDVPAGQSHDLWEGANWAPRVLQATANTALHLEAKFDSVVTEQYQFQGIVVQESLDRLLRFEVLSRGGDTNYIFAALVTPTSATVLADIPVSGAMAPNYIRVRRDGDEWTMSTSANGVNFTVATIFTQSMTVTQVGVHAGNNAPPGTTTAPAFVALVDYFFNADSPILQEDTYGDPVELAVAKLQEAAYTVRYASWGDFRRWFFKFVIRHQLKRAAQNLTCGHLAMARWRLEYLLKRTDGCVLRGAPDSGSWWGPYLSDWVVDCQLQNELYAAISDALELIE